MVTHPKDVRELFNRHEIRCTRQREEIYLALAATKTHPSAEELHKAVRSIAPGTSLATIYNSLDAFCEAGLCRKIPMSDGVARYDADMSVHVHVVATDGRLMDMPDDIARDLMSALPRSIVDRLEQRLGTRVGQINWDVNA